MIYSSNRDILPVNSSVSMSSIVALVAVQCSTSIVVIYSSDRGNILVTSIISIFISSSIVVLVVVAGPDVRAAEPE